MEDKVEIITDSKRRKIVVIKDIIFRNRQNIKWDDVEEYLKRYIGKDLPDEYAHSSYTSRWKGTLAKTKATNISYGRNWGGIVMMFILLL